MGSEIENELDSSVIQTIHNQQASVLKFINEEYFTNNKSHLNEPVELVFPDSVKLYESNNLHTENEYFSHLDSQCSDNFKKSTKLDVETSNILDEKIYDFIKRAKIESFSETSHKHHPLSLTRESRFTPEKTDIDAIDSKLYTSDRDEDIFAHEIPFTTKDLNFKYDSLPQKISEELDLRAKEFQMKYIDRAKICAINWLLVLRKQTKILELAENFCRPLIRYHFLTWRRELKLKLATESNTFGIPLGQDIADTDEFFQNIMQTNQCHGSDFKFTCPSRPEKNTESFNLDGNHALSGCKHSSSSGYSNYTFSPPPVIQNSPVREFSRKFSNFSNDFKISSPLPPAHDKEVKSSDFLESSFENPQSQVFYDPVTYSCSQRLTEKSPPLNLPSYENDNLNSQRTERSLYNQVNSKRAPISKSPCIMDELSYKTKLKSFKLKQRRHILTHAFSRWKKLLFSLFEKKYHNLNGNKQLTFLLKSHNLLFRIDRIPHCDFDAWLDERGDGIEYSSRPPSITNKLFNNESYNLPNPKNQVKLLQISHKKLHNYFTAWRNIGSSNPDSICSKAIFKDPVSFSCLNKPLSNANGDIICSKWSFYSELATDYSRTRLYSKGLHAWKNAYYIFSDINSCLSDKALQFSKCLSEREAFYDFFRQIQRFLVSKKRLRLEKAFLILKQHSYLSKRLVGAELIMKNCIFKGVIEFWLKELRIKQLSNLPLISRANVLRYQNNSPLSKSKEKTYQKRLENICNDFKRKHMFQFYFQKWRFNVALKMDISFSTLEIYPINLVELSLKTWIDRTRSIQASRKEKMIVAAKWGDEEALKWTLDSWLNYSKSGDQI